MKARTEAFTAKNINSAWRGFGLFPFNPSKVLRHISDDVESTASISSTDDIPKTPSTTHSNPLPLDNIQQTPSPFDIQQFTIQLADLAIRNAINTPLRQTIPKFMRATEKIAAENILLKKQLNETEQVVSDRKERKSGKRVVLKDVPHNCNKEVAELLKKCEEKLKKTTTSRGRGKKKQEVVVVQESESESEKDKEEDTIES